MALSAASGDVVICTNDLEVGLPSNYMVIRLVWWTKNMLVNLHAMIRDYVKIRCK